MVERKKGGIERPEKSSCSNRTFFCVFFLFFFVFVEFGELFFCVFFGCFFYFLRQPTKKKSKIKKIKFLKKKKKKGLSLLCVPLFSSFFIKPQEQPLAEEAPWRGLGRCDPTRGRGSSSRRLPCGARRADRGGEVSLRPCGGRTRAALPRHH